MLRWFLYILLMFPLVAMAQEAERPLKKFVVADIETRVPVRGVIVSTGDGYRDTTNYRGICFVPESFDTLTVAKANYLTERILPKDLRDSTFLIPNSHRISEVTVWGKDRATQLQENVEKWSRQGASKGYAPQGVASFDLAKMLDKRYRRDQKNLKKALENFEKMDVEDDDPIVNAYKKTLEAERLKQEEAKKLEEQKAKLRAADRKEMEDKIKQTATGQ